MTDVDFKTALAERIARVLHARPSTWVVVSAGYTAAARWLVTLDAGERVFVKMGTTPSTAAWLRNEAAVYARLAGSFMPRVLAWVDDPDHPLLVLEDLSAGLWPPPWTADLVGDVRSVLEDLHSLRAPLRTFREVHAPWRNGWRLVAEDPAPFLRLGLVSRAWLESSLPVLIEAADRVPLDGEEVCHFDVRSDNLCRTPRGVVLVDWNCACLGNGALDTGFWLPSLQFEGGPPPETILPTRPDIAAHVSGYFANKAGLPEVPDSPHLRRVQRQQLGPALAWVVRALCLTSPTDEPRGAP